MDPRDQRIAELESQLARGQQRKHVLSMANALLDQTLFEARLTNAITDAAHRHNQLDGMLESLLAMLCRFAEVPWVVLTLDLGSGRLRDFAAGDSLGRGDRAQLICRETLRGSFPLDENLCLYPLGTPERLVGVFAVPRPFGSHEKAILELFAYQMLTPIERGILFEHRLEADRMKDEFLRTVSHELRTPLHIIKGFLYLLEQDRATPLPPRQAEWIREASEGVRHMSAIVADLLDYSAILAGKMTLRHEIVALKDITQRLAAQTELMVREHGQQLAFALPSELPAIWGDERRIFQVLLNLVANACKHAGDGCRLIVRAEGRGSEVRVEVQDDGRGMCADELARLFQPFTVLEQAGSLAQRGIGLGLLISRGLIEAHGGSLGIYSEIGRGTTVGFTLPAAPGMAP